MNAQASLELSTLSAAITEGTSEMTTAPKATPKKASKPKAKAEAKAAPKAPEKTPAEIAAEKVAAEAAKAEAKAAKEKEKAEAEAAKEAARVLFKTASGTEYELKEGFDPAAIKAQADELAKSVDAIASKDSDLLSHYLKLGGFQSTVSGMFKSSKLYGQYLKEEVPASQALDAALRSNCKWLFEALNTSGTDGSDLLTVLGINRIEDFKSGNPTVIKREYKQAKQKAEKLEKAEKMGISGESEEESLEALNEKEAAAAEKAAKKALKELAERLTQRLMQQPDQESAVGEAVDIFKELLTLKGKAREEALNQI